MKNLSFFKGLLIAGFLATSVWIIAISTVSSILETNNPTQETVQAEIYSNTPPT